MLNKFHFTAAKLGKNPARIKSFKSVYLQVSENFLGIRWPSTTSNEEYIARTNQAPLKYKMKERVEMYWTNPQERRVGRW